MTNAIEFGPRLIGSPTGTLRAAVLVRPSPAIERAATLPGEPGALYERALEQHAILADTLRSFGVATTLFDPHAEDPNEAGVCDAAVVFEDGAVMMRQTPMGRRAEADRLEAEFARIDVPLAGQVVAPGLLDGGDVLLAGTTAFIGMTPRGNALGRAGFAAVARAHGYRVVEVAVAPGVTSLHAVAGVAAKDIVVLARDKVDAAAFAGFTIVTLERGEDLAAGLLPLGERHAIADLRFRTSLRLMRKAGIQIEAIDLYDFAKIGLGPSMLALATVRA